MINIWEYYVGDKIQIIDVDNEIFVGRIDSEECSDLMKQEDNIGIITDDGRYISIYQSEIKEITAIDVNPAVAKQPKRVGLA